MLQARQASEYGLDSASNVLIIVLYLQPEQAVLSYAKYKLPHIDNIETTKEIALNLENVITTDRQQLNQKLYEKGLLKLAYDENVSSEYFNLVTKSIMIDETNSQMVKIKQLLGNNEGVYDIPYLRPEACMLFNTVINKILVLAR